MARKARKGRAGLERWNQLVGCLRDMNSVFNCIKIYPPTHTEVASTVGRLHESMGKVLAETDDVGYGFMDEMLYIEGAMSIEETAANQMLVDRFARCRVKYMTVAKGVAKEELLEFFKTMNAEALKPTGSPPQELLEKAGIKSIRAVEADLDDVAGKSKLTRRRTLFDWYEKTLGTVKTVHAAVLAGPTADLKPLHRAAEDLVATMRSKGPEPFLLLPVLGSRLDPHLTHTLNVAILCSALGEAARLNSAQLQTLVVTALLHDMGRCIIPVEWAADQSPLTLFERAVVAQHPAWSFLLLARNPEVPPGVSVLAARHHDASCEGKPGGYVPDALQALLHLADSYDLALFSDRRYWRKHGQDRILLSILRHRGRRFHPACAKLLAQCVGLYPPGTLVRLDDGQRAIVVRPNASHPARPKVWLFDEFATCPEGTAEAPPIVMDLMESDGLTFSSSIKSVLSPAVEGVDIVAQMDKKKEYLLSPEM